MPVVDQPPEISFAVALHHIRLVETAKQMAPEPVLRIESLGLGCLEPMHSGHQIPLRRLADDATDIPGFFS